jgi:hypothetical protein
MFTVPGRTASRAVLYQSVCNPALAHVARPTEWNFRLHVVDRKLLRKMSFIRCYPTVLKNPGEHRFSEFKLSED